jgi:glucosyl-3-phosphoglycerate synthase
VITFAILGHDEADTVSRIIAMARAAVQPGDRVIFVDSASTDGSAEVARACGAEVFAAPLGKGAAMRVAIEEATGDWVCFLDADVLAAAVNIPAVLRARAVEASANPGSVAHVLGDFSEPESILSNTVGIYAPLVAGLFPEIAGRLGSKPLTGFRAVRRDLLPRDLPDGYGVEAHLNIAVAMAGGTAAVVDVGRFSGKFKPHRSMGREIAAAVLDAAERFGRLAPSARPAWEAWVDGVVAVISRDRGAAADRAAYLRRLAAAASRPLPSALAT